MGYNFMKDDAKSGKISSLKFWLTDVAYNIEEKKFICLNCSRMSPMGANNKSQVNGVG